MRARLILAALLTASAATIAHAAQTPTPGNRDARITTVTYRSDDVVRVHATHGISTMLIFDEDERFETISLGDTQSWQVVPSEKGNILFVKPIARNVPTNMNVVTTKRVYYLELNDHAPDAGRKVFGIRFHYPDRDVNAALRQEAEFRAAHPNVAGIDKESVNIDYSFTGDSALKPTMVFDDGRKTFFRFGRRVPAIFAVDADYSETLRNFRKEGDYIVVDGVATQYTLRDGDRWICIFNLRRPDFAAPDPAIHGPRPEESSKRRARRENR